MKFERRRVLFVCHRVPFPPKRGGKIRPFNIVRHFHEQGHEVTVASIARSRSELEEAEGLSKHCSDRLVETIGNAVAWSRMVAWLPSRRPSSFAYFYSPRLHRRIVHASNGAHRAPWDLVFVHCSSVAPYVRDVRAALKVIDFGDMDSQKWREYSQHRPFPLSAGYWIEAVKLENTERRLSAEFDLSTCTTRGEMESLRNLGARGSIDWFPNGVDAEFYQPDRSPYDPQLVSFVGRMDYFPNQQAVTAFCNEVLPELQHRRPGTRFEIVGADPSRTIRELAKRPGVTVTGSVPDVRPYVRRAALTVAPLTIARGTQNKILESMAMGVPVVCSRQAAGGVDAVAGTHLLVCDDPRQMLESILGVLDDKGRRASLADAGRERVLSNHSWGASLRRLDSIVAAQFSRRASDQATQESTEENRR